MKDPSVHSENTPSHADTPSIQSYSLSRKWKSPILGVARIVLRDVFLASFFLAYFMLNLFFFAFARENSPVQPLVAERGSVPEGLTCPARSASPLRKPHWG